MRALFVIAVPIAFALVLALLVGILFESVRLDGTAGLLAAVGATAAAGALVAALMKGLNGLVLGTIAGGTVIPLTLALKVARWPDAPLVGDGAGLLLLLYGPAAAVGAVVGAAIGQLRGIRR